MDIEEVFDDVKKGLGDKGFLFFIIGAVIVFIIVLMRENSSSESAGTVTIMGSYPDAVTNADTIISTLQNDLLYSQQEIEEDIKDAHSDLTEQIKETNVSFTEQISDMNIGLSEQMQDMGTDLKDYLNTNFEATNDYINNGLESNRQLMEENFDELYGGLDDLKEDLSNINVQKVTTPTKDNKPASSTNTVTTSYYKATPYKGVSIVDGLKAIGIYSIGGVKVDDVKSRKALAEANGIKNYTGTASQNASLLTKLKAGKLIKV